MRDGAVAGDPTEAALCVLVAKGGVEVDDLRRSEPRVAEVPFEAERKFSATLHAAGVMYVKGRRTCCWSGARSCSSAVGIAASIFVLDELRKLVVRGHQ